jgi:hypothetical protein
MMEKILRLIEYITGTLLAILLALFLYTCTAKSCQAQTTRECVTAQYLSAVGVREETGNNDGVEVQKYLASVGLDKGYAWCAAFVNYTLQQCSIKTINSGWCPDWFPKNKLVFKRGLMVNTGTLPQPGDVFGIYFSSKKRIAHEGFIHEWRKTTAVTVEGNTNAAGSREGDGVYKKIRLQSQIDAVSNWIDN